MKRMRILFIFSVVTYATATYSMEFGRHDGSDYCYYVPGSKSGAIYPTVEQKRALVDTCFDDVDRSVCKKSFLGNTDFAELRKQFPIVHQVVNGYPLIYLDSGSTGQMPQPVLDAIVDYYATYKSNAGRGNYAYAEHVTQTVEETRAKVANFIGAQKHEIVFTPGTTAGINLVAHAWAEQVLQEGDEIIISEIEHNANLLPWQQLALRKKLVLRIVPVTEQGVVDLDVLDLYLSEKTKLVAFVHQSNVLGTTNDIKAIAQMAHKAGARVLVDAAQSIVHQRINVADLDCDFLAFGAHKVYGPTGVGALYIKQDLFDQISIQNFGGGMVIEVGEKDSEFKQMPHCLESGTQPLAQIIGLGAVIDFVQSHINMQQAQEYETTLVKSFARQLRDIPGITIISHVPGAGEHNNMVTFIADNCHAYDIASYLNKFGIAVRAGYHCVHLYHEKLGCRASVRVSFSVYNTQQEVDFVISKLRDLLM